jgi:hypothetical protein
MFEITGLECVLMGWMSASVAGSIAFCAINYRKAAASQQGLQRRPSARTLILLCQIHSNALADRRA